MAVLVDARPARRGCAPACSPLYSQLMEAQQDRSGGDAAGGDRPVSDRGLSMTDGAAEAVRSHYEAVGDLYRAAWGDSLHFAAFKPGQDRADALASMERMLVDGAGMRPGMSVLDVGCGTGAGAPAVAPRPGAHGTGLHPVPRPGASAHPPAAGAGRHAGP